MKRHASAGVRMLAIPALLATLVYARFLDGYWLGDDFSNLHRLWNADRAGLLWQHAAAQFFSPIPSDGAFYRPVMIATLALNEWLAGRAYAGWYAFNLALHVANVVLVGANVAAMAAACGRDGRRAGTAAALFFALSPALAEGVFWVSARADALVTLLTLAGVYAWTRASTPADHRAPNAATPAPARRAFALPLALLAALGCKESAAVFPLQMLLVAIAWPARLARAQIGAVAICFVLVGVFMAARASIFGDVWHVYRSDAAPSVDRMRDAIASVAPWWQALTAASPTMAKLYVGLAVATSVLLAVSMRGARARLAGALLLAAAGLVAATLLNLGGLAATGEGGRLAYSPMAWMALGLGVAGAAPMNGRDDSREPGRRARRVAVVAMIATALTGAFVLERELVVAERAANDTRSLAAAIDGWARTHAGLTLLVIAEHDGPVVTTRNAQGALVLPPVQATPLLHRVLPTLPAEIPLRHDQFVGGLASRLDALRPSQVDARVLDALSARDAPRWPDYYACWSMNERKLLELPAPDPAVRAQWVRTLEEASARCNVRR